MVEDRLVSAWLYGGPAVRMVLWGTLAGGLWVLFLGVLERRWRKVSTAVWGLLPVGLMLFGAFTSSLRLEGIEDQLSTTGGRWILSRVAHQAVATWEPMWVSGWVVATLLTGTVWFWVGPSRGSLELKRTPVRGVFTGVLGALTIAALSGVGGLQMAWAAALFVGVAFIARTEGLEARSRVFLTMATVVGSWTLAWTGWVTQWEALVMGDLPEDLALLKQLPAWEAPWCGVMVSVGVASMLAGVWRDKVVGRASWLAAAVFTVGLVASFGWQKRMQRYVPEEALRGLAERMLLPEVLDFGDPLYGRVGGGCLVEWRAGEWIRHSLPWTHAGRGLHSCEDQPSTLSVAVPGELPVASLPDDVGVKSLLWVVDVAPDEIPDAFDAWRYATVPTRWALKGEERRGPTPVRLTWGEEGWMVDSEEARVAISGKSFTEWLPDIRRGELILSVSASTPVNAVVTLCQEARRFKPVLLGCAIERPDG